ncbi:TonB-dependent receptor [Roseovarius aestuarii]|nr:TonB-dependent receptor [Roseovarius aestuarii]
MNTTIHPVQRVRLGATAGRKPLKTPMFRGAVIGLMTSSALITSAQAQEVADLGTIVLTATGQEQSLADVQASVQVIENDMIETSSARNATELLRNAVGIDARSSGSNEVISIRGQGSTRTLVLVDGQERTGAYGTFNLNNIPTQEIERIEIVRGPMSALYGADALGGVINVITRRPGDDPGATVSVLVGASPDDGDRATVQLGASVETGDETLGQRFSVQMDRTDGYALPTTAIGEDFSSMDRISLAWAGSWRPSDGQELRWRLEGYRQKDERDAIVTRTGVPYTAIEEEDRVSADLSWTQDLGQGQLTLSGMLSYSEGMANRAYPVNEGSEHLKARLQARYDVAFGDHNLSFAAGAEHEEISIDTYTNDISELQTFALVQDEWYINDRMVMTMGVRVDDYESFGTTVNPRFSIGSLGDGFTWRVGAGTAFRAPNISERYANITRGLSLISGNPNLEPETSVSYEVAAGWRDATRSIELVYHDSKVDDLIGYVYTGRVVNGYSVIESQNVDKARIKGLELTGSWQPSEQWDFSASFEYLDARDEATGDRLTGRYRTAYSLASTYSFEDWKITGRLRGLQGYLDANDTDATTFYTSGFTTVDVNAVYAINDSTEVSFGVDNVFDEQMDPNYSTARYREDVGRFAYFSFKRSF